MKKLIFFLLVAGIGLISCTICKKDNAISHPQNLNVSKYYINSLKLLPQNPNTSDIIKVVCHTYFPTSICTLDSSTINNSNFQILVFAYYTIGDATLPCSSIDTLTIGNLSSGDYILIYYANNTTSSIPFDSDVDTLNFTIQ